MLEENGIEAVLIGNAAAADFKFMFRKTPANLGKLKTLAAALDLCRQLEIEAPFEKLAARELKMKARDVRRIKDQAAELMAKAEATGE